MLCAGTQEGGKDSCEVRPGGAGGGGCHGPGWEARMEGLMLEGKDLLVASAEPGHVR